MADQHCAGQPSVDCRGCLLFHRAIGPGGEDFGHQRLAPLQCGRCPRIRSIGAKRNELSREIVLRGPDPGWRCHTDMEVTTMDVEP